MTVSTVDLVNTSSAYYAPAAITRASDQHIHVSGQVGSAKDGSVPSDYASQIHLALFNLRRVLIAANATTRNIAKLSIFIVNYDAANRRHTRPLMRFLDGHRPAITLVPVPKLAAPSWLFEVDAVLSISPTTVPRSLPAAGPSCDVIVVGAGLAGLAAAHELKRYGYTCIILESRDRVGGKTWSRELQGGRGVIDVGAAWINDVSQKRMSALAKRYQADLIEQNTQGNCVLQDSQGDCSAFPYGEIPKFDEETRRHLVEIRDMVEADCQAVDAWKPNSIPLDCLTFEAYLTSRGANPIALATATVWTRAMLGQEPCDISALFFLNYCKAGGGLLALRSDRKGGGQHLRVRQGTQLFARGLASDLPNGSIMLSTSVKTIKQSGKQQISVCAGDAVFSARKVITTVPSPILQHITFDPPLPPKKLAWSSSTQYGYYTKAMMQFTSPFWIQKGFCGLAQSFQGPASVVRDTSSPQDDKHILTCFMAGDPGKAWSLLSEEDRVQALLTQLEQLFGVSDLRHSFEKLHSYDWSFDECSGWGCPSVSLAPGVIGSIGADALRKPWYNMHFAGTETAGEWKGYMEGAVRSGERAASEVVASLGSESERIVARL
ncbi:flavin-containing amine oxidoreductase [Hortaea werneckii]|nr:flavin-containing amine oxidoreductase [Hortaea werneckii]